MSTPAQLPIAGDLIEYPLGNGQWDATHVVYIGGKPYIGLGGALHLSIRLDEFGVKWRWPVDASNDPERG